MMNMHGRAANRASNEEVGVGITVTVDEDLVARASELTGITDRSALLVCGLERLIQRESAKKLAALGGTEPHIEDMQRR